MKNKSIVYIVLAVVVLLGLFFLFKPKQGAQAPQASTATQQATASATPESNTKTFELVVKGNKMESGPSTIQVNEGDEVTLKIMSDEEEELHVHAYDKSVDLVPNQQATLTFTTNISGRFPFELEKSKTELGVIEVQPK